MSSSLVLAGGIVVGVALAGSFIYWQGSKSCAPRYQAKILKAQIKNRDIALAYYKSATANNKSLAEEAEQDAAKKEAAFIKLKDDIKNKPVDNITCIDDEFLRSLRSTR